LTLQAAVEARDHHLSEAEERLLHRLGTGHIA
jgi:hypothetical protein